MSFYRDTGGLADNPGVQKAKPILHPGRNKYPMRLLMLATTYFYDVTISCER